MKKYIIGLLFVCLSVGKSFAQSDAQVDPGSYDASVLEGLLLDKITETRLSADVDELLRHEILDKGAKAQADENRDAGNVNASDDIGYRVKKEGGTDKVIGAAGVVPVNKGKVNLTYMELAQSAFDKVAKAKTTAKLLSDPTEFYIGIGTSIDADKKKLYVSIVLGKLDAINAGADKKMRKTLPLPYSKSSMGLVSGAEKECKACAKFKNWKELYDGLERKGKYVYLRYNNMKELKKLLAKEGDGLAIDFVQKAQYKCGKENIYNKELPTKGAACKPAYTAKLFGKNMPSSKDKETNPKNKSNEYYGYVAKLKGSYIKKMPKDVEMNLLVILDGKVCRTITRSYLEEGDQNSFTIFSLYPDTMIDAASAWVPSAENQTIEFKVPFELNKFDYKKEDIKPILDKLNEPDYKINKVFIEAHSSIEGDSTKNKILQEKRANSIVSTLGDIQGKTMKIDGIKTTYGWEIFQAQLKKYKGFEYFQGKTYGEMLELLKEADVMNKLDTLLKAQRYAAVKLDVTYDFTGANEEKYVANQFNKAIQAKDAAKALKIQKYAIRRVLAGKYDANKWIAAGIPNEAPYASLLINQIYLDYKYNHGGEIDDPALKTKIDELFKKAPDNGYAMFNKYLLFVKNENITDTKQMTDMQAGIDKLYTTKVSSRAVDALNLEFQFKVMDMADTMEAGGEEIKTASLDRIKKMFNAENSSWQNALKLGYIFEQNKDFEYATKIMAPFLNKEGVNNELYFAYIAAAVQQPHLIYTKAFRLALSKAKEADESRFCQLFGAPYQSFQLMDHPMIKSMYCETCGN